jgi:CRP/FNR family transcriptional regulator
MKEMAERLQEVSFFQDLSSDVLELVMERMVHRTIPAGTVLFRKGQQARGVYVLVSGRVEIYRSTADGREQVLHTETPVQSVAELPVFDGGPYPASGRTVEESDVYFLPVDDFQRLYREHPEISDAVIRNLGKRLRDLVCVVETISLRSVLSRVAKALLERAEESGAAGEGGEFVLEETQTDLAHKLATSRESVARALGDLRRRNFIASEGSKITILSPTGLVDLAGDGETPTPLGRR